MTDNIPHFPIPDIATDTDTDTDDTGTDAYGNTAATPPALRMRADGWFPARQRTFLESLAQSGVVTQACEECQISPRSAYNLRLRDEGIGFRLGWEAAILIARGRLVDTLMERAINGWDEVITRFAEDSDERIRHRIDNRLAMSLLGRLDRHAEVPLTEGTDAVLARIIAQDFEAFLDLIESGAAGAAISLFLALRTPKTEEHNPHQNDPIGRCELCGLEPENEALKTTIAATPESYAQAEAADFCAYCTEGEDPEDIANWCCEFPPPPGFDGEEWGTWEDGDGGHCYTRELTEPEHAAVLARRRANAEPLLKAAIAARDTYFGFVPEGEQPQGEASEAQSAELSC
jgi:hypothetical protein